jgi:peptidoglycan hydrolase-like amidase
LPAFQTANLSYKNGTYYFSGGGFDLKTSKPIRLVPNYFDNFFTLSGYTRVITYRGKTNFNSYRGVFEYRYSSLSKQPYIINELSLDLYIAGIAETTDEAAPEFIKALLIAARSYAYASIDTRGPDGGADIFDVYASTIDQLYLGYDSELLMPKIQAMQKATYGMMVTYNSNPVSTPYFGHSNGYTVTRKQAWGGNDQPWLKSVLCKYDVGLAMYGHGVGMSTRDAGLRALKDGWKFVQILQHYYSGVKVEKVY